MRFRDRMIRFMSGRNGVDAFGNALFILYLVLALVGIFVSNAIYSLLVFALGAYMIFRMFSRNIPKRQAENMRYLRLKAKFNGTKLGAWLKKMLPRVRNIFKKRYRTCPHCKAELCLPRKRGKHTVHCPRCQKDFSVHIVI